MCSGGKNTTSMKKVYIFSCNKTLTEVTVFKKSFLGSYGVVYPGRSKVYFTFILTLLVLGCWDWGVREKSKGK